jgi:methyl-accepting chemotaxis protein
VATGRDAINKLSAAIHGIERALLESARSTEQSAQIAASLNERSSSLETIVEELETLTVGSSSCRPGSP